MTLSVTRRPLSSITASRVCLLELITRTRVPNLLSWLEIARNQARACFRGLVSGLIGVLSFP